jgi:hypothetical protein
VAETPILADLVVEADGPLSVRCGTCDAVVAGTQFPTVTFHLRTLVQLRRIHEVTCGKGGDGRG